MENCNLLSSSLVISAFARYHFQVWELQFFMHRYSVFISGVNRQLLMFLSEPSYIFNISTGKFEQWGCISLLCMYLVFITIVSASNKWMCSIKLTTILLPKFTLIKKDLWHRTQHPEPSLKIAVSWNGFKMFEVLPFSVNETISCVNLLHLKSMTAHNFCHWQIVLVTV